MTSCKHCPDYEPEIDAITDAMAMAVAHSPNKYGGKTMGYDTYASGSLKLREGKVKEELLYILEKEKIFSYELESDEQGWYNIEGVELRIYSDWFKEVIKTILKVADGELHCEGEENDDIFDIILKDGKIYVQEYEVKKKGDPIEMTPEKEDSFFGPRRKIHS